MTIRELAQETIYELTRDMDAEAIREIADTLPADVGEAAKTFASRFIPGMASWFQPFMTEANVSVPYELYAIANGREQAENELTNEAETSEKI